MKLVSNTEASTFQICEQRHYYSHVKKIAPVKYSRSLNRGIIGHEALAAFYQSYKDNESIEKAMYESDVILSKYTIEAMGRLDTETIETISALKQVLDRFYREVYPEWPKHEILEVEKKFSIPMDENVGFAMTLDLLIQIVEPGINYKEIMLVDHKFVYNFAQYDILTLKPQLIKYVGALRAHGYPVKGAMLNQLRHRYTNVDEQPLDKLFRQDIIYPTAEAIQNNFYEQYQLARQIKQAEEEYLLKTRIPTHNMSQLTCGNCSFRELCVTEMDGGSISNLLATDFKVNTYGYDDDGGATLSGYQQ